MSAEGNLLIGSPKCRNFSWEEVLLGKKEISSFQMGFLSAFQLFFSEFFGRLSVDFRAAKEEKLCLSKIVIL